MYEVVVSKQIMGTHVEATVLHPDVQMARTALVHAFQEMERIEGVFSTHQSTSEVTRINQQAGGQPVPVSAEVFALLVRAKGYTERCAGIFDITIGPLARRWGFNGPAPETIPDSAEVTDLLRLIGPQHLKLNPQDTTVQLAQAGMAVDLGGIAKGYAVDQAGAVLKQHGVIHFLLNAGGDLLASGTKADGSAWRVGIRHPRDPKGMAATLALHGQAIATSGDYERFTLHAGERYHHILDPRTGYPARGHQSMTVLAPTAEEADVWATCLFIAGPKGIPVAYLGIDSAGQVYHAPELAETSALTVYP